MRHLAKRRRLRWPATSALACGLLTMGVACGDGMRAQPADAGPDGGEGGDGGGDERGDGAQGPGTEGGTPGPVPPQSAFRCDADARPGPSPLRRLTMREYGQTLRDLMDALLGPGAAPQVETALDTHLGQFPVDGDLEHSFARMDGRLLQRHADGYFATATALAAAITDDPATLRRAVGDCVDTAPADADCLPNFIARFGRLALRRPLEPDRIAAYASLAAAAAPHPEGYRAAMVALLLAPEFIFHLELRSPVAGEGTDADYRLDAHGLAARLSYHFWQTMPDAELRALADSGALYADATYRAQVERLAGDPRAQLGLQRFFHEWLQLDHFAGFTDTPAFRAFADGVLADRALYDAAVAEVDAMVHYYAIDHPAHFAQLLSSGLSFTDSSELASLYGVPTWEDGADPPSLPQGQRAGLLGRAAVMMTGSHTTNPFKRGAFVLRQLLCTPLSPPASLPAEALALPPPDAAATTRERFAAKVGAPACASCHQHFAGFGYALEAFDGLGRHRTTEVVLDPEGQALASLPIDSASTTLLGGEALAVDGPAELGRALADSSVALDCFARKYFRFTRGRMEQAADGCSLAVVSGGATLTQQLRALALHDDFKRRVRQ